MQFERREVVEEQELLVLGRWRTLEKCEGSAEAAFGLRKPALLLMHDSKVSKRDAQRGLACGPAPSVDLDCLRQRFFCRSKAALLEPHDAEIREAQGHSRVVRPLAPGGCEGVRPGLFGLCEPPLVIMSLGLDA